MSKRKTPDFIGIGMERAGTSWLFTQIAFHPDVWVPPLKELHFFDVIDPRAKYLTHRYSYHLKSRLKQKAALFVKMPHRPEFSKNDYMKYLLWDFYFFTGAFNTKWYQRLFSETFTQGRISGEITPAYSNLTPDTIKKILDINPDMKFILMVRNPVERMWSGVVHHFRHIKKRGFQTVDEDEIFEFLKNSNAHNRSNLASILETWQEAVPAESLLIKPFEDIAAQPESLIGDVYNFIGAKPDFLPPEEFYKKKINNYTLDVYQIPDSVREYMQEQCETGVSVLKNTHPDIVKSWQAD